MNPSDDLPQQLTRLREQLAQLEAVRDLLGDAAIAPKQAELEGRLQALLNTAGGAVVSGSVTTTGGDFTGRDWSARASDRGAVIGGDARGVLMVTGDGNTITLPVDQVEPLALLHGYYRSLAEECRRLPLGSVDPRFVQPGQKGEVSLAEVYTDLDVVAAVRAEDEAPHRWGLRLARGEGGERLPLLQAIAAANATRLTLIGDAGSGKTTFVNYLSYRLAQGIITAQPPPLPAALRQGLLVRLVLRNVVRCLPLGATQGSACVLWDALRLDMGERLGQAAADRLTEYLQQRLLREGGLILLDGLDEVPEAARRRQYLLESIQALAASLPPHSRLLLTARPYAYADPRWQLPGFQLLALAPFRREQIEQFIAHWHQAVRASVGWDSLTATARARHLSQALFQKPYLADLASRPLLLTLMATLDSSRGQLPDDRAKLYEESVELLLSHWQQNREVRGADGQLV
jgi:predicted NACHT family NTPase